MYHKTDHSTTVVKDSFPYQHHIDEENKIVYIHWNNNGQIGRYGVPYNVNKFYPGYSYQFE
jgi:hypothetical protein